ncbi:MAG: maleylpyruvate isomerase family mycothiol-dependent enzyme [Acidimicrobiales bacterium]
MEADSYLAQLRLEGGRLAAAARAAPTAPVPSCPAWDMPQLLAHIASIHRWVAEILRSKATARRARSEAGGGVAFAALVAAYDEGLEALVAALAATDPDELVWNWRDSGVAPALFWFRRMAQETAVHRWDAEAAAGSASPFDPALAVDGIDEFLGIVAATVARAPIEGLVGSLALVASDADASWHLELAPGSVEPRSSIAPQATVRAPVSDLYLWLLHRIPPDAASVAVAGARAPVDAWGLVVFD